MAIWNYTSTSPGDVFEGVSLLTNGLFGTTLIILIWLTVFYRQKDAAGSRDALAVASFVASIAAILMGVIGQIYGFTLVNDFVVYACIVLFLGSLAMLSTRQS